MDNQIEVDGEQYFEEESADGEKYFTTDPNASYVKIACKCGENKMFSANISGYAVYLTCNKCGYKFEIYSG